MLRIDDIPQLVADDIHATGVMLTNCFYDHKKWNMFGSKPKVSLEIIFLLCYTYKNFVGEDMA